jgi:hypothetical protein
VRAVHTSSREIPSFWLNVAHLAIAAKHPAGTTDRLLELPAAMRAVRDYLEQVRRTAIVAVDGVKRDSERVRLVLQSIARHSAAQQS